MREGILVEERSLPSLAFSVVPRKRKLEALDIVRSVNPQAFVTFEDVETPTLAARRASWIRK